MDLPGNTINESTPSAPVAQPSLAAKPVNEIVIESVSTATISEGSESVACLELVESEELADYLQEGKRVIHAEAEALLKLEDLVNEEFGRVVALLRRTIERVVVTGVGKSGIIGQKIAATISSTGTPSMFVHAGDAAHGDLGMIGGEDIVLAVSKSGESAELAAVISFCGQTGVTLIALMQKPESTLGRAAQYQLLLPDIPEACGMKVAPTTSSTATLALGDALAVALSQARGFNLRDFGLFHPGGNLGTLSSRVDAVMGKAPAICPDDSTTVAQALLTMATQRKGCVGIVNTQQHLVGVITESNLHQHLDDMSRLAVDIATPCRHTADPRESVHDVLQRMNRHDLSVIFVVHPLTKVPIGVVHVQDLLGARLNLSMPGAVKMVRDKILSACKMLGQEEKTIIPASKQDSEERADCL